MKILHVYNRHRFRAGADYATHATIDGLRNRGIENRTFVYDSQDLAPNLGGKIKAFASGIYARRAVGRFADILTEYRPDIVHAYELYPMISPWILPVCSRHATPVVLTCYDYDLTCPIATHYSQNEICTHCLGGREHWAIIRNCRGQLAESAAYALRHAVARRFRLFSDHVTQYIVLSDFQKRWLSEHEHIPPAQITVIPPVMQIPESASDPSNGSYVAFVGRFAPEKGIDMLINAARITGLPFKFAGDSPTLAAATGTENIELVYPRSREELARFYRNARILVAPSIWFETFPAVIAEAMSHGIPVITSRLGALTETVEDGVSGLLIEPGDVRDLAEKIECLWSNPDRCRQLGAVGRERITRLCNPDTHIEEHIAVYRQISGGNSSGWQHE